jgi:hypothetical protein
MCGRDNQLVLVHVGSLHGVQGQRASYTHVAGSKLQLLAAAHHPPSPEAHAHTHTVRAQSHMRRQVLQATPNGNRARGSRAQCVCCSQQACQHARQHAFATRVAAAAAPPPPHAACKRVFGQAPPMGTCGSGQHTRERKQRADGSNTQHTTRTNAAAAAAPRTAAGARWARWVRSTDGIQTIATATTRRLSASKPRLQSNLLPQNRVTVRCTSCTLRMPCCGTCGYQKQGVDAAGREAWCTQSERWRALARQQQATTGTHNVDSKHAHTHARRLRQRAAPAVRA